MNSHGTRGLLEKRIGRGRYRFAGIAAFSRITFCSSAFLELLSM